jgi:hypothetical protein
MEHLWRIADENRPDPAMQDFVDHVIAALDELMVLRSVAHQVILDQPCRDVGATGPLQRTETTPLKQTVRTRGIFPEPPQIVT